ncbi:MAG: hypothetical protein ACP5UV_01235 [Thermoplasmata archaeon]
MKGIPESDEMKVKYPYNYKQYVKQIRYEDIANNSALRKFIRIQRLVILLNVVIAVAAIAIVWGEV